jgi:hypothetical protein
MLCEKEGKKTRVYPMNIYGGSWCEDPGLTKIHRHEGKPVSIAEVKSEQGRLA